VLQTAVFALGASLPLLAGALLGLAWRPPRRLTATAMAFAAGALISAVAFELFEKSYQDSDAMTAGLSFAAGAAMFVAVDTLIDRWSQHSSGIGLALLAGVTLDGIPENTALGVSLVEGGSIALLVAIFASNFPEALAGAVKMRENGRSRRFVLTVWVSATVLLALAVVAGRVVFASATPEQLAIPVAFAGGAVLASVVDSVAPEAFEDGGPVIALASAAGFFVAFMLGH
jgi:ZIP family zinc transporter